jgi:rhodanese-related sulfurtransferase
MIKQLSVQEAHQQQQTGGVYVDVRSVPEFDQAHPSGAYNIPLLHLDERTGQMRPNTQFLSVVQANFPVETPLIVGCQAGMRSQQACEILGASGYTTLANVRGGFGGSQFGDQGWMPAGLPVETSAPGRDYMTLSQKALESGNA